MQCFWLFLAQWVDLSKQRKCKIRQKVWSYTLNLFFIPPPKRRCQVKSCMEPRVALLVYYLNIPDGGKKIVSLVPSSDTLRLVSKKATAKQQTNKQKPKTKQRMALGFVQILIQREGWRHICKQDKVLCYWVNTWVYLSLSPLPHINASISKCDFSNTMLNKTSIFLLAYKESYVTKKNIYGFNIVQYNFPFIYWILILLFLMISVNWWHQNHIWKSPDNLQIHFPLWDGVYSCENK